MNETIAGLGSGSPARATDMLPIQRGSLTNAYLQVSDIQAGLAPSSRATAGIYAADYGVTGSGYFLFSAVVYEFALSQAAISSTTVTYTGTIVPSSAISNIVETPGSVVTLTVTSGNWVAGQIVNLSGLTTGTWLNGHAITLLAGTTPTSLIFNDPTSHGTQTSHSETGTATINFAGYSFTIAGFTNAGNNGTFTIASNTSTTLVCTNASGVNETHAATAASNTVDCGTASFLTQASVGQIVFASNLPAGGFSVSAVIVLPQGTITAINSATQIVVSVPPTAAAGYACLLWGNDESTALTNAWNAAVAATTQLILPGVNANGDGPAVILVQSAQLCTTSVPKSGWNSGSNESGTGGSRAGYGAQGGGINSTYIVPTPNFNTASVVASTCFLYTPDGANFHDFTIFGGGNGSPGSGYSTLVGAQIITKNNAVLQDMAFIAWGTNQTNGLGIGLQITGGEIAIRRVDLDMFGQVGCKSIGTSSLGYQVFECCTFWDNGYCNLWIAQTSENNPVVTIGCNFGGGNSGVSVTGGAYWRDIGSVIGLNVGGAVYPQDALDIGYVITSSGGALSTGFAFLNGTQVYTSAGNRLVYINTGSTLSAVGSTLINNSSGHTLFYVSGSFTDGGGNTFGVNGGSLFGAGTGPVFGALSITGTAQTAGNVALTNFGTSPTVTALKGNTRFEQFTLTVGTTPSGTATVAVTFPTPFLVTPIANLIQVGGNNALPGTFSTFTPTTITATSATFTYDGTLSGGDTLICQLYADLP